MVVSKWFKYSETFHPISGEMIQTSILVQMAWFNHHLENQFLISPWVLLVNGLFT